MSEKFPRVGIAIFVFNDGKFLMGRRIGAHGQGTWTVPGGHLDFGEGILHGAAREVLEETGISTTDLKIAGITNDIFAEDDKHYITIWVTSKLEKGEPKILEPDKFVELGWFDFDILPNNLFLPWEQLLKSDFIDNIKRELN